MIADPVLADEIREDARQTLADQLAAIDEIQESEYVNYRLEYYERNIGDLITDLAENDCDCVVDVSAAQTHARSDEIACR